MMWNSVSVYQTFFLHEFSVFIFILVGVPGFAQGKNCRSNPRRILPYILLSMVTTPMLHSLPEHSTVFESVLEYPTGIRDVPECSRTARSIPNAPRRSATFRYYGMLWNALDYSKTKDVWKANFQPLYLQKHAL